MERLESPSLASWLSCSTTSGSLVRTINPRERKTQVLKGYAASAKGGIRPGTLTSRRKGASESRTASRHWGLDLVPQIAAGPSENILWRPATTKRSLNQPLPPTHQNPGQETENSPNGGLTSNTALEKGRPVLPIAAGRPVPTQGNDDGSGATFQRRTYNRLHVWTQQVGDDQTQEGRG
jgi:hypothetical protein